MPARTISADDPCELQIVCDASSIDSNALLRQVLDLNVTVVSFGQDQRHLNEVFMHLTQEGVRA